MSPKNGSIRSPQIPSQYHIESYLFFILFSLHPPPLFFFFFYFYIVTKRSRNRFFLSWKGRKRRREKKKMCKGAQSSELARSCGIVTLFATPRFQWRPHVVNYTETLYIWMCLRTYTIDEFCLTRNQEKHSKKRPTWKKTLHEFLWRDKSYEKI